MTCYTAIIGDYDYLKPIRQPQSAPWDFVCFTDQDEDSKVFDLYRNQPDHLKVWKIIKVDVMDCGVAKTARYYKIMFHKHIKDEISIWVDGTFFVNTDLRLWVQTYMNGSDFITIHHPIDDCLYTDGFSCLSGNKGDKWDIMRQISDYKTMGIPENNGLISSGVLVRKRTQPVIDACKLWWEQVENYSERDQIGFGYVNWKLPGCHKSIFWDYTKQKEFWHCPHRHKKYAEQKAKQMAGL